MRYPKSNASSRYLAAVLISLVALPLSAQLARRPVSVGLSGGGTVPVADFANDVKTGWNAAGYLQYEPDRNIWGVRGEASYFRAAYTEGFLADVGALPDDKLSNGVLHLGAAAVLTGSRRDRMVTPYLLGGLGMYRLTATLEQGASSQSFSENGFGFNGGVGVRFGAGAGIYVEARFHQFSITSDPGDGTGEIKSNYQMIPVSFGIRF